MSEDNFLKNFDCILGIGKRFILQIFLFFLMPYLWNYEYGVGTIISIFIYTSLYVFYWEFIPKVARIRWAFVPYLVYGAITSILFCVVDNWSTSLWLCWILPIYGLLCLILTKLFQKYSKVIRKKIRGGKMIVFLIIVSFIVYLKILSVLWMCKEHGTFESEKNDILERRNYLVSELVIPPQKVLNAMPSGIGTQFQGEWALYSCSMLSAALVNISHLYPKTKRENLKHIDSLINIVMSPEIRYYDTMRWGEDPLNSLSENNSHVSFLSHLAWIICGYREISGNHKYDKLLTNLCETMNRRIHNSSSMNLATYPGESIYVPDMLVAIVALNLYADTHKDKYRSTVKQWVTKAQKDWLDEETGLLASFIDKNGSLYEREFDIRIRPKNVGVKYF